MKYRMSTENEIIYKRDVDQVTRTYNLYSQIDHTDMLKHREYFLSDMSIEK